MSFLKKVLIGILITVVVLIGAAFAALKSGIFTAKVKEYAKQEIARLTGKEIDIEKIEIGLVNHVTVKNLSIPLKRNSSEGGEFIGVKSIIFRFNIVDLFIYKRDIDKTLSHVIVKSPVIHIKREAGKFNIEDFIKSFTFAPGGATITAGAAPKISIPVNRVIIDDGKVTYEDTDRKFMADISDFKGSVTYRQKSNSVRVYLAGKTQSGDKRNLKIDYNYFLNNGSFKSDLSFKDAELKAWLPYLIPQERVVINDGIFSLDLTAQGSELAPGKFTMNGAFTVSKGNLLLDKGRMPVDGINLAATIENDRINISQAGFNIFGGKVSSKGEVKGIYNGLSYDGSMALSDIDSSMINENLMSGKMSGLITVRGNKETPRVNGTVKWEKGRLAGINVRNVEAAAVFDGKTFELKEIKGSMAGGAITGSGALPLKPAEKNAKYSGVSVLLGGFLMSEILNDKNVKGKADMTLKINGSFDSPSAFAVLTSDKCDFNGTPGGNIKARMNISKSKASIDAVFDYAAYKALSLSGKLEFRDSGIRISAFELKDGKQQLAGITGDWLSRDKTYDILSTVTGIKIPNIGIKLLEGKAVEGLLNGRMIIKGTSDSPVIEAVLETAGLKIKNEPQTLKVKMNYGNDTAKIEEFTFNDNASGSGELSIKKKIFNLNLDLKNLNGNTLKEITGLDIFSNSVINGNAVIKKEQDGYGGSIAIGTVYSKGEYKSVDVDIKGNNNEFTINAINIKQKQGSMKINGSAKVQGEESFAVELKGSLRDYLINNKAKITADFMYSPVFSANAGIMETSNALALTGIYLNGERQDDLNITAKSSGKMIPEFTLKMGEKYNMTASLAGASGTQINMLAELRNADLLPVYALLGLREKGLAPDSTVTGKFEINGAIDGDAVLSGNLAQTQGVTNVHGDVAFRRKAVGYEPYRVNLTYNLINVDVNNLARLFDDNFKEQGRATGKGLLKGRLDALESSGDLTLIYGRVLDMPYDSVTLKYAYKNKIISVEKMLFDYRKTSLTVFNSQFEIKDKNSYQAKIQADMKNFSLKGNKLNGGLNFYGRIENFKSLKIDGSLSSENFMFKRHMFQPFVLKTYVDDAGIYLKTSKGKSTLNALIKTTVDSIVFDHIIVENEKAEKILDASGFVMKEKGSSELLINGSGVPPQMANDMLGWEHRWAGDLQGNVKITGNLKDGLGIAIMVTIGNGMVDDLEFDIATGLVLVKDDWVDLSPVDPIVLTKTDKYTVKVTGKIPVPMREGAEERMKGTPMDLHVSVKDGDLSMIKFVKFIDEASGPMDLDLNITGTKEFPNVSGKIEVTDATARIKYLFDNLTHLYANILIKDNVMDIYTFKADTGDGSKGTLKIENLDDKKGGTMKWIKPYELNWKVTNIGDRVRLSDTPYMEFINGDADLNLSITGLLTDPNISGTMKIYDTRYRYPVKMKNKFGEPAVVQDNYAKHINWDVKIYGGENNYFYNDDYSGTYAQVYLKFSDTPLIMQGKGNDMKIYGSVGITRGTYKYISTDFSVDTMKESKVTFDGMMKPILDVYATTKMRRLALSSASGGIDLPGMSGTSGIVDLNIDLHAWGRVGNVKMDVSSEPYSLNRDRLLYILTFGKDSDKAISADDAYKMGVSLANAWIKGQTQQWTKVVPVDEIVLKVGDITQPTPVDNPGNTSTVNEGTMRAEVGLGKYLTDDLYFDYRMRLMQGQSLIDPSSISGLSLEHALGVEYSLDPANKLVFDVIMRDPNYYTNQLEGQVKWQTGFTFDQWGAKPTPTPGKK